MIVKVVCLSNSEKFSHQREMTQEQERRVLFALGVFTLVTLALGIMALIYVYAHPTINLR